MYNIGEITISFVSKYKTYTLTLKDTHVSLFKELVESCEEYEDDVLESLITNHLNSAEVTD